MKRRPKVSRRVIAREIDQAAARIEILSAAVFYLMHRMDPRLIDVRIPVDAVHAGAVIGALGEDDGSITISRDRFYESNCVDGGHFPGEGDPPPRAD